MNVATAIFLCLIPIRNLQAKPIERSDESNNSTDKNLRVIVVDDVQNAFRHTLQIRDRKGNTLYSETTESPHWFLWHAQWSPTNNYVAITTNVSKTEVDTFVLRKDKTIFTRLKLPEIERDETCHIVSDGWKNKSNLKLDISYGNNRKAFPGDVISSYTAVVHFTKMSKVGTIVSRTRMIKEIIPHEE